MRSIRLLLLHAKYEALELIRQPAYVVSTVIFPAMFFWFFGVPNAQEMASGRLLTASFSAFALLGVVLFQFSIGIAEVRGTPWESFMRLLPLSPWVRLAASVLSGVFFAILSIGGVLLVSYLCTPAAMPLSMIAKLIVLLFLCALPFGLMGMTIGLSVDSRSALPVANMVYLPLSFAGGLWIPPSGLPKVIQEISRYLPTRYLGELVWAVSREENQNTEAVLGLIYYSLVFLAMTLYLYRREHERTFR